MNRDEKFSPTLIYLNLPAPNREENLSLADVNSLLANSKFLQEKLQPDFKLFDD